jgi:hypothetical protein
MFIFSIVEGGVTAFRFVKHINVRDHVFRIGTDICSPVDVVTILLFGGGLVLPALALGGL